MSLFKEQQLIKFINAQPNISTKAKSNVGSKIRIVHPLTGGSLWVQINASSYKLKPTLPLVTPMNLTAEIGKHYRVDTQGAHLKHWKTDSLMEVKRMILKLSALEL